MIQDLVAREEKYWELYIYLRKIFDIVMSPRTILNYTQQLRLFVRKLIELHLQYVEELKPKFHFLMPQC